MATSNPNIGSHSDYRDLAGGDQYVMYFLERMA